MREDQTPLVVVVLEDATALCPYCTEPKPCRILADIMAACGEAAPVVHDQDAQPKPIR